MLQEATATNSQQPASSSKKNLIWRAVMVQCYKWITTATNIQQDTDELYYMLFNGGCR